MLILIVLLILTITVIAVLSYNLIKIKKIQIAQIQINKDNEKINKDIENQIKEKKNKLNEVSQLVYQQKELAQSVSDSVNKMRASAEESAQQAHQLRVDSLAAEYKNKQSILDIEYNNKKEKLENDFNNQQELLSAQIQEAKEQLESLKEKQLAYIKAQQRQQEINEQLDYYRLNINENELNDIQLLRNIQPSFVKKEAIDKIIWEVYYKPAYDILMSHLFENNNKVCGIYKITDLATGLSYVGQSVDIRERWRQHIKTSLSYGRPSNKLYQQMQKSGQNNFTFEILEEVSRDKLNERESYWIEFYQLKDYGLNSNRGQGI